MEVSAFHICSFSILYVSYLMVREVIGRSQASYRTGGALQDAALQDVRFTHYRTLRFACYRTGVALALGVICLFFLLCLPLYTTFQEDL